MLIEHDEFGTPTWGRKLQKMATLVESLDLLSWDNQNPFVFGYLALLGRHFGPYLPQLRPTWDVFFLRFSSHHLQNLRGDYNTVSARNGYGSAT